MAKASIIAKVNKDIDENKIDKDDNGDKYAN